MKDIVKTVIYDRGAKTLNGETKYFSLIAMIVASDQPLIDSKQSTLVGMGTASLYDELKRLPKYLPPHKFGDITGAILDISGMSPDDLDPYERKDDSL